MELARFRELYASEAAELLRVLTRALLALEGERAGEALADAFRAAHSLKGMAATMGYAAVADRAHTLEDALERLRVARRAPEPAEVDALLDAADALEEATRASVAAGPEPTAGSSAPTEGERLPRTAAQPPAEASAPVTAPAASLQPPARGQVAVDVRLTPDAALPAARALLARRAAAQVADVLATVPPEFDHASFESTFRLVLRAPVDRAAVEAAIRSAGDVAQVAFADAPAAAAQAGSGSPAVGRADSTAGAAPGADAPGATPVGPAAGTPGAAHVRVELRRLDAMAAGIAELSVVHARLAHGGTGPAGAAVPHDALVDRMGRLVGELQAEITALRMEPVSDLFDRLPRLVRDTARRLGRDVELRMEGGEIQLDRAILDEIADPLLHLVRNAIDHGIEPASLRRAAGKPARGRLTVRAERERSSVRIVVEDDGGGVDAARVLARARAVGLGVDEHRIGTAGELFRLLSHAGFTTAEAVTEVSGRGVGLDAVATRVRALGGAIDMETERGRFTRFVLRLPVTLALAQALRIRVGGEDYAIPLTHVAEAIEFADVPIESADGGEIVWLRGTAVPLVRLGRVLRTPAPAAERAAVLAESGERRAAIAVDELVGREQILIKTFDAAAGALPFFSGATLLADGRPALVLDPLSVL